MSIHCLELGWIGKYAFLGPRDLPQQGFCTPRPSGNLSGLGVQNPCFGKSLDPRGRIFQYIPPLGSVLLQYFSFRQRSVWLSSIKDSPLHIPFWTSVWVPECALIIWFPLNNVCGWRISRGSPTQSHIVSYGLFGVCVWLCHLCLANQRLC